MGTKEWFAEWFDTSYYHSLYKDRDDLEASEFISRLMDFLKLEKASEVLDLACGKGRHSVTLNKLGYHVLGADLSPNSIEKAKVHEKDSLKFTVHDMREIIHDKKFKAVFNLFTSFGYFDNFLDNKKVIHSIHQMLEKDGYLVIDFMNSRKVIDHLVKQEAKQVDGITYHLERRYDGDHIFKDIRFEDKGKSFHFTERVQALLLTDFEKLLIEGGFEIIRTFGDFFLNEFNETTSDRLIIIAKRH